MGSGRWDDEHYKTAKSHRATSGIDDFHYSKTTHAAPAHLRKVHESLDPKLIKGVREARDSDEHPETVPVAVLFDVTGSMHMIPRTFQEKLPKLMTVLTTQGGLAHPQVLFGAIGDATCDQFPFQVGQFESDNRCDEQLRNIILEGGGGGQIHESYELAYYFAGRKTELDSVTKRGKKGYLFTLGDEAYYSRVPKEIIEKVFGDTVQEDLTVKELLTEALEKFEVYHIHVQEGSYRDHADVLKHWRSILHERFILLEKSELVCETIAAAVALLEGADFKDVTHDLGVSHADAKIVETALAKVASSVPAKMASGTLPAATKATGKKI
jgi:hypothetical protein